MMRWVASLIAAMFISTTSWAESTPPMEGIDYQLVTPAQPTSTGDKIEVVELFWYGCPHCFQLEPLLNKWKAEGKPANAEFVRIPASLNPKWELHARAYYAAEVLGILDKSHEALFDAMHAQKKRMNTEEELAEFHAGFGVSASDFRNAMHSFAVETKVRRAKQLSERYGITGVPMLIVNGKYRTGATLTGSNEALLNVVNALIEKESGDSKAKQ